jgi:hypothetical protein
VVDESFLSRRFARDVAVKVLANLIAAALIYLGAALAGIVSANGALVVASWVIALSPVVLSFGIGLWHLNWAREHRRERLARGPEDVEV